MIWKFKHFYSRSLYKINWGIAHLIPKRAALYAFIRVCVADGKCPRDDYSYYYDYWVTKHKLKE